MTSPTNDAVWSVADAKARLSELINDAGHAPQTITRHGSPIAIVIDPTQWHQKQARTEHLAEFLIEGFEGVDIPIERIHDGEREIAL